MGNCTVSPNENQHCEINTETGEVTRYRKRTLESLEQQGTARGKIPKLLGKNTQKRPVFQQLFPLGAHVMAMARLTGRQYQILFLLIRDSNYSGMCFTHPKHIASELEMDVSDVSKALKVIEKHSIIRRKVLKNNGHCYIFNPKFMSAKEGGSDHVAQAMWASLT